MLITVTIGDIIFYTILIIVILVGASIGIAMKVYELRDKYRAKKRKAELEKMGLLKRKIEEDNEAAEHFKNAVAAGMMLQSDYVLQSDKQDPPPN